MKVSREDRPHWPRLTRGILSSRKLSKLLVNFFTVVLWMLIIDRYSWYMEASSRVKVRLPLLFVVPFFSFLFMSFFNDSREDQWFHKGATNRVNRSDSGKRVQYVFSTIIAPCCETSEKNRHSNDSNSKRVTWVKKKMRTCRKRKKKKKKGIRNLQERMFFDNVL